VTLHDRAASIFVGESKGSLVAARSREKKCGKEEWEKICFCVARFGWFEI
jgi:hypothetical protein